MVRQYAVRNRQPQAGALAHLLGGEERLKNVRQHFRRHARAVVLHQNLNKVLLALGGNMQASGARRLHQRLEGVVQQIHQHLLNLVGVTLGRGQLGMEIQAQLNAGFLQIQLAQFSHASDQFIQINSLAVPRLFAGEGQEVADELGGAVAFVGDLLQIGADLLAQLVPTQDEFHISFDDRQRVVQLVGNA